MKRVIAYLIFFTLTSSDLISQSTDSNESNNIQIPIIGEKCFNGSCVKDQFFTQYEDHFALVAGSSVKLRDNPSLDSNVIGYLILSESVNILYEETIIQKVGNNKGKWVYVKRRESGKKGWVFDYYLARPSKFKKVETWNIKEIKHNAGDYFATFICTKNGIFKYDYYSGDNESVTEGKEKDYILQYLKIVYFPKKEEDDFPIFFYFDDDNSFNLKHNTASDEFTYKKFK